MKNRLKQLKDNNYYYNLKLKKRANELRQRFTKAEEYLWNEVLIARKLDGFRFIRQTPVLYYVPDFMCKELGLIIEVDGKIHRYQKLNDAKRQDRLESCGFKVLRFTNQEVLTEIDQVQTTIKEWIRKNI